MNIVKYVVVLGCIVLFSGCGSISKTADKVTVPIIRSLFL